jgi:hypothetical protein
MLIPDSQNGRLPACAVVTGSSGLSPRVHTISRDFRPYSNSALRKVLSPTAVDSSSFRAVDSKQPLVAAKTPAHRLPV